MSDTLPLRAHVVYRGCTYPPTFMGVPVVPFVVITVLLAVPGFWALILVGLWLAAIFWATWLPLYLTMRFVSRNDPWALLQIFMRWRVRLPHANRVHWGAITYSPLRLSA